MALNFNFSKKECQRYFYFFMVSPTESIGKGIFCAFFSYALHESEIYFYRMS